MAMTGRRARPAATGEGRCLAAKQRTRTECRGLCILQILALHPGVVRRGYRAQGAWCNGSS